MTTRSITRSVPPRLLSLLALGALLTPSAVAQCPGIVLSDPNPLIAGNNLRAAILSATPGCVLSIQPGVYQGNFTINGTDITLQPTGAAQSVILDGGGSGTVLTIQNVTAATQIRDLVVRNGNSTSDGGGIYVWDASPQVSGCRLEYNAAFSRGGGMFVFGDTAASAPRISGCQVVSNSAGDRGGGIAFLGDTGGLTTFPNAILTNTTLRLNTVGSFGSGLGGGVYAGVSNLGYEPRVSVSRCRVNENVVDGSGGGVAALYGVVLDLDHSTIGLNVATLDGGGVWCDHGCSLTVRSCYVAENQAEQFGGGIYVRRYNQGEIRHSVIDHNLLAGISSEGGGVYISNEDAAYNGGNTSKGSGPDAQPGDPALFTARNNLIIANQSANGAGVTVKYATPLFSFNTFEGNVAAVYETGGMLVDNPTGLVTTLTVRKSIYWDNLGATAPSQPWEVEFRDADAPSLLEWNDIQFTTGSALSANNIDADPLWTTGYTCPLSPIDGYFLSQPTPLSPCVDPAVFPSTVPAFLSGRVTDPTGAADLGIADIGYHYPPTNCP